MAQSIFAFLRYMAGPFLAVTRKPARQGLALLSMGIALAMAATTFAGSIPQTVPVYHLGPGTARATGDFISHPVATGGLGSPYIYYIEVPPGLASLQVEIFDADVAGTNDTAGFTETYALSNPSGTLVTSRACTGTVAVTCPDNAWANLATVANPAAGHWRLTLTANTTGTTTGINGYAIRAHDGTAGAGGTELNVYAESFVEPGLMTGTTPVIHNFYPYITSGCDLRANNFDFDVTDAARCSAGGANCSVALTTRSGAVLPILAGAPTLSVDNALAGPTVNNWTTATNAGGYGIWRSSLSTIANYITLYFGAFNSVAVPPTAQPEANTFRIYLPTDAAAAPVKPYVEQSFTYTSGPNPPVVGSTTRVTVTVRVVNPTPYPVTFSAANLVTANVPGAGAVYAGGALISQGTITAQPAVGGTGNLTWNPGVVATNATVLLTYRVDVTPAGAGAVNIIGIPTSNGTTAQYVDDTGNAAQARATHTFGPLCGLSMTATQGVPALTVSKSSSPSGALDPGELVTYTVTVTNSGAATIPLSNIVVTDTLPTGMTYVSNSTVATGPVIQPAASTVRDNFTSAAYTLNAGTQNWSTNWTELNDDAAAGTGTILINAASQHLRVSGQVNDSISRSANLTGAVAATLTFDLGNAAIDVAAAGEDGMAIQVSRDGVTFTTLETFNAALITARSYDITAYISATTTVRFLVTTAIEGPPTTEYFSLDNVQISYTTTAAGTRDNIAGGANPDLVNGIPPSLVVAGDNFALAPGATLTTTFRATVNNPLAVGITQVTNTATASSGTTSRSGSVTNAIDLPTEVLVTGTVWLDVDGDGINDAGEPGITGVTVAIYSAGPNGVIGGGDDVLAGTVTTDANGDYGLGGLPAGNYYTDVTDTGGQLGGLTTAPGTTDPSALLTLTSGSTGTANFGYVPTGSTNIVEGTVWGDADGDGRQDGGEAGIGGATVQLVRAGPDGRFGTGDDVVAATTATDADGGYLFTGITAEEYVVRVVNNATLTGYTPTSGPDSEGGYVSSPVTVVAGDVAASVDFGFDRATLYTVSDRIWNDADGDGVFDANEDGLGGVTVNLRDSAGNIVATVTTNADGTFAFSGVSNGNYTIAVSDMTGVLNDMNGTTAAGIANSRAITVSGVDINNTATPSFGYNQPGLVGGVLWSDADGDGVRDAGEVALGGVPIELRNGICTPGSTCPTTTTAADGSYQFTGVTTGAYTVVVTTPPAGTQTGDPDQPGVACTTCNNQGTATVPASGSDPDLDFGYRNTALADVSGTVFNDLDGDGIQEAGEGGLAGVTVELRNAAGIVVATVMTDASGNYLFPDVPAGNYTVVVTDQDAILSGSTSTSGLDRRPITVAGANLDIDFGYGQEVTTAQFSSVVWLDENTNGVQGSAEVGLSGVTVNLYRDSNLDGIPDGAAVATSTTGVKGNYVFRNLAPGTYLADAVESTLPGTAGQLTATTFTSPPGYASVSLSEGEVRSDGADFGYTPAAGTAALSGVVWADADGDGFRDPGEARLSGVTITIYNTTTNAVVATVNTDIDGSWAVLGLAAGSYAVAYDQSDIPAGYLAAQPTNLASGNTTYTVTIAGGNELPNLSFGFRDDPDVAGTPYGTVSGTFYHDVNANSTQNVGEEGMAGVTMYLVDGTGQIVATTTTDLNGNYSFTGVSPGTYTIVLTDVNAVLVGRNSTQLLPVSVIVTAGGVVDADAGYSSGQATLTTVGGTVWVDSNNNGVFNPGEFGLLGTNLELWLDTNNNGAINPGTDNLVRAATSNSSGAYTFSNVPAGAYLVRVFDAPLLSGGYTKTTGPTPGADNNSQVNPYPVTVGASSNFTADFGYFTATATISGTVFEDANSDGVNNSEATVGGAVVSIYRVANGLRQVVATITTGPAGTYTSPALPPGSYQVVVDTQGTVVAGYDQTTQAGTGGVEVVTVATTNVTGRDFGFFNDATIATAPITLASFQTLVGATPGTLDVKWTTATEAGNVGFLVYGRTSGGEWQKLTPKLVPSKAVDSLEPQTYAVTLSNVAWVQEVALEDVSIHGKRELHGPFAIGTGIGAPPTVERTKWPAIRQAKDLELKRSKRRVLRGKPAVGLMRAARIAVRTPGIQRVTHEQLLAAGIDLSKVLVAQIAVTDNGQPVARAIGGRPIFGPGSYIEFIGQVTPTLYSKENVYLLTVDPTKVRYVKELKAPPPVAVVGAAATYSAYPNREYSFSAPTGDPWYDAYVLAYGAPASLRRDFTLSAVVPGAAQLTMALWGYIDFPEAGADHHVVVKLNGQVVHDGRFDGVKAYPVNVPLAAGVLQEGPNSLEVVLPQDTGLEYDMVALEGFEVRYQRQSVAEAGAWSGKFATVSSPFAVRGLSTGPAVVWQGTDERLSTTVVAGQVQVPGGVAGTYWLAASSGVNTPGIEAGIPEVAVNTQVDYLIVTHPAFLDSIAPIEALQATRKLTTAVVTTESLYARYTDHAVDAKAISSYLAQTRPQFVLLVGGDVVDYHDNLKTGSISFVPTQYARTDAVVAYSPSDAKHADWTGDNLPDTAIGRLPVRTVAELQAVIAKLQAHEQRPSEFTAILVTGKSEQRSIFTQEHREIGGQLGPQWQVSEAAIDLVGKTAARQLLLDAINGGVEVTSYYGHSSYGLLDFDRLFTWQDVVSLTNQGRPTVMTMWGCWNSYFVSAGIETLANRLLLTPGVGAVAVFGSATLTQTSSHQALGSQLFRRFGGAETLGEAIMEAQQQMGKTNPAALDAILGMNLLGDPATPLFR